MTTPREPSLAERKIELAARLFAKHWDGTNNIDPKLIAQRMLDAAEAFNQTADKRQTKGTK